MMLARNDERPNMNTVSVMFGLPGAGGKFHAFPSLSTYLGCDFFERRGEKRIWNTFDVPKKKNF